MVLAWRVNLLLRAARLLATDALLDRAAFDAPAVRAVSAEAWEALALGDADLSGAVYNEETRWLKGFAPGGNSARLIQ